MAAKLSKYEIFILDYVQLLMIAWAIWATKLTQNAKTWSPNHQKMKCSLAKLQSILCKPYIFIKHLSSNVTPPQYRPLLEGGSTNQDRWRLRLQDLFPLKWFRMTWNGQFYLTHNFSNLFPPKWFRMTWNGQFHLTHNFSNLFPLKWLIITCNSQFHATFQIFSQQSG